MNKKFVGYLIEYSLYAVFIVAAYSIPAFSNLNYFTYLSIGGVFILSNAIATSVGKTIRK